MLLVLFLIAVGAGIQFPVPSENLGLVLGLTVGVMFIKVAILFVLALLFKTSLSGG